MQEVIDDVDERIVNLREEFGSKFCDIVTNALKEIMTYNPYEKYIVEVPWNYIIDKEATMKDIVLQLGEIIKWKGNKNNPA
jgi:hypothetical protein